MIKKTENREIWPKSIKNMESQSTDIPSNVSPDLEEKLLRKMWAITGGIASGKGEVEKFLRLKGNLVINADELSRHLQMPGEAGYQAICNQWKNKIPNLILSDSKLNKLVLRQKLSEDESFKIELENIMHPLIRKEALKQALPYWHPEYDCFIPNVFYSAALIFEKNLAKLFKGVLFVQANRQAQIERLMKRDQIDLSLAEKLLDTQWSNERKIPLATLLIDNQQDLEKLHQQLEQLYAIFQNE